MWLQVSGMFSTLTISWFSPILSKGWRKPLEVGDLFPLPKHLVCESAYHAFLRGISLLPTPPSHAENPAETNPHSLDCDAASSKPSTHHGNHHTNHSSLPPGSQEAPPTPFPPSPEQHLYNTRALLRLKWLLHGPALRRALALIYTYQVFVFFQPVLLSVLTNQLTHGRPGNPSIWVLPVLLFLCPLLGSLFKSQSQLCMIRVQIALRSQLSTAVYRKCLRLSVGARAALPSGRVVNLMSADVAKICDFMYPQLMFMAVAPLAVLVSLIMLWFQIGWATLVGLGVLLLSTPVSNMAVRATQRHRNEMMQAADGRMKLVGQFLVGVRVIKMYHWEQPQAESITKCRAEELRALRNMIPSKVAMQTLLYVLPQLAGVLSFLVVGLTQPQQLTAARAFSSLVLFQIMRFPLLTLSTGLVELGAAIISAHRITSFMASEEQHDYVTRLTQPPGTTPQPPHSTATRWRSLSVCDAKTAAATFSSSPPSPMLYHRGRPRHSEGGPMHADALSSLRQMPDAVALEAASGGGGDKTVLMYRSTGSFSGVLQRVSTTPRASRAGTLSLLGVEPGLTVRAAGFKWAAAAAAAHQEQKQKEREAAAAEGVEVRGVLGRLSQRSRRTGIMSRPFMEVLDSAGESLVARVGTLRTRLARALRRRRYMYRDPDYRVQSSSTDAATAIPGSDPAAAPPPPPPDSGERKLVGGCGGVAGKAMEEERVKLLPYGNSSHGGMVGTASAAVPYGVDEAAQGRAGERTDSAAAVTVGGAVETTYDGKLSEAGARGVGSLFDVMERVGSATSSSATSSSPASASAGFVLRQIDLRVRPGELACVVGQVGSGKSSLVSAVLGEMELLEELQPDRGDVVGLGGRVAYVAQQAWIVNASLLDNVTMGKMLDEARWSRCVEACALGPDLELMPAGRDTEIGEKGINLSGGQKQRLSLARAMYQEADVYLLDDPLSAVDVHVGSHIFSQMIRGALGGAAVLLVTNAVQYLPHADSIIMLHGGEVVVQGSFQQCMEEPLFRNLLEEFRSEQQQEQVQEAIVAEDRTQEAASSQTSDQQRYREALRQLPSMSHGVSTAAYQARRASVELVQRQQQVEMQGGRSSVHLADLDEGADMVDSLMRMSADGGGGGGGELGSDDEEMVEGRRGGGARGGRDSGRRCGSVEQGAETRPLLSVSLATLQNASVGMLESSARGGEGGGGDRVGTGVVGAVAAEAETSLEPAAAAAPSTATAAGAGRLTEVEDRELGQVKWKVYGAYFRAFHVVAAGSILFFWSLEQGTRLATNAWLAHWSHSQQQQQQQGGSGGRSHPVGAGVAGGLGVFASVYLLLAGVYTTATFFRSATNNLGSYRASKILHERTVRSLLAAPLSFFEATPIGRILNRLSRDVDEMDYNLAMYQQQLGNCVMRLVATIIFLCVLQPAFTGVVIPLAIIYFVLQKYFRRSSIELQRIDSVTRSPVYANFAETMSGLDTLRAYRMQERFKARHESLLDTNATAYYNARVADEWLSLRLDLIGATIVMSIAALNVALRSVSAVSPALVALALAEAIDLTSFLNYAVKVSAMVESRYNAVERLLVYSKIPPEEAKGTRAELPYRPPGLPAWPASGKLEFRDVWMSYREGLAPVLQGVTFKVMDGQKVGIVGRTGSGKSSLIVALFRLVEPLRGQMLLDGINLRTLGLGAARTALSVIPQEPMLFSGTVRSNLDPWHRHSDFELWAAVGVVALRDHVRALGGLSAVVAEGGSNFSVGQRQLMCVARALLRQPRLLVADEATASVDPETDGLIQRAIRTHFKCSTVLAIAHRLNTILDADVVLVMEAGRVGEFGPVPDLLANPSSAFAAMVRDAGLLASSASASISTPSSAVT